MKRRLSYSKACLPRTGPYLMKNRKKKTIYQNNLIIWQEITQGIFLS